MSPLIDEDDDDDDDDYGVRVAIRCVRKRQQEPILSSIEETIIGQ